MVALIGTSVGSLIAIGADQRNDDQPTQGGLSNQHKSAMGQTHSVLQRHAGMAFPLAEIGPLSWRDNRLKSRVLAMGCSPHSKKSGGPFGREGKWIASSTEFTIVPPLRRCGVRLGWKPQRKDRLAWRRPASKPLPRTRL